MVRTRERVAAISQPDTTTPPRRWRFGCAEFDERDLVLSLDGRPVEIERKPLLVLRHLLEHAGEMVSKDALVRAVWPGRIVTDSAITRAVARLRDALDDRAQALVRTHHGFGYRLVAPLRVETPDADPRPDDNAVSAASPAQATDRRTAFDQPERSADCAAERRPMTVLFCDLVDSTYLAESLDPEAFRALLIAYRNSARQIGARYQAHLALQAGDGLLMYFGWPAAHDNDAELAVRCACELLREMKRCSADLGLRIGIHSGEVVIGRLAGESGGSGGELLATGSGLHLASRLQALAEPDSILISDATFRLVPGLFVTRDYGPQLIRGLAQPVRVHQVIYPSGVRSRLEAAARLTRFVGREEEIALLESSWRDAVNGRGRAILFTGEPGLGKSRLLMQFRARLAGRACSWHECRADALGRLNALHPLIELTCDGEAPQHADDAAPKRSGLEQGLIAVPLNPARAVPPPAPALQRSRARETLMDRVERLARAQPLILAFEDLHWADQSSLEFLGVLLAAVAHLPILLLMTARPEFPPPWDASRSLHVHTLGPLPLWEVERMLGALTGGARLAPALGLLVHERASGVPLFVEELTRSLIESGQIVEQAGMLAPRVPLGNLAIPESLHGLLLARLDRLGAARELIQIAAMIGREVPMRLLQRVSGIDPAVLRQRLGVLIASALLYRGPDDTYVFKHALIRDSACSTLLRSAREKLHGLIARTLEEHFAEHAAAEPEVLAAHYEQAQQFELAARWYEIASQKATSANLAGKGEIPPRPALAVRAPVMPQEAARDRLERRRPGVRFGKGLMTTMGYPHPGVGPVFARARDHCVRIDGRAKPLAAIE